MTALEDATMQILSIPLFKLYFILLVTVINSMALLLLYYLVLTI